MIGCGGPDDLDCQEVLGQLFAYLDSEDTELDPEVIRRHLQECSPCMSQHDHEVALKLLIKRSCRCEAAPETLRLRVQESIRVWVVRTERA